MEAVMFKGKWFSFTLLPVLLALIGCSGTSAVSPEIDTGPDLSNSIVSVEPSTPTQNYLWGYYDLVFDFENETVDVSPNRSAMFTVNVTGFLNNSVYELGVYFNGKTNGPGYVDIDLEVTIIHPLAGLVQYDGYDVRGVFIGDGSATLAYNPDLGYPVQGTDQMLLNADGYTRWFNPSEFYSGGIFSYIPGDLASPSYDGSATLNPYKYFGEGLSSTEDLWNYLVTDAPDVGYFINGYSNTRNYQIRFQIPSPGVKYNYAVVASWDGGPPQFHPAHAPEAVAVDVINTSTVYYVDETTKGGDLKLDISVFDWHSALSAGVMEDYAVYIESTVLSSPYMADTADMTPVASGTNFNTFRIEVPADNVPGLEDNEFWVIVEYQDLDYTNSFGVPNDAGSDPLAPCFRYDLPVLDEIPTLITVISPNGGEVWLNGSNEEISWSSINVTGNVDIHYSRDNFTTDLHTIAANEPNDGSYMWNSIPYTATDLARIRIRSVDDPLVFDISDADFSIIDPSIEVITPNGGEVWDAGSDQLITWTSEDVTGTVDIEYSKDNFVSDINPISLDEDNDGSYMWSPVPDDSSSTVRVRVSSTVYPAVYDTSDADFNIFSPSLTLLTPNGGEKWAPGASEEITWTSQDITGNVDLEYSRDNFTFDINPIAGNEANDGSYMWTVPCAIHDNVHVRIISVDTPSVMDTSDASFTIDSGWADTWGIAGDGRGKEVEVDDNGYIYVAGYESVPAKAVDAYVRKYDQCETLLWEITWGGPNWDAAFGIVLDGDGYFYVCGYFEGTVDFDPGTGVENRTASALKDAYVSKFSDDGTFQWVKAWGGSGSEYGTGVAVDSFNAVYISGTFEDTVNFNPDGTDNHISFAFKDAYISKFDSTGTFQWANTWGDFSNDECTDVEVDSFDNPLVCGYFPGTVDFDPDPADTENRTSAGVFDGYVLKFDSSGDYLDVWFWGGTSSENVIAMELDALNNIYVTGDFEGTTDLDPHPVATDPHTSLGNSDAMVLVLDSTGAFQWSAVWGGADYDDGRALALDGQGYLYVGGAFNGIVDFDPDPGFEDNLTSNGGYYDGFVCKYEVTGLYQWARGFGGPSPGAFTYGLAADWEGHAYATGYYSNTAEFAPTGVPCNAASDQHSGSHDSFLVRYLPDGCW